MSRYSDYPAYAEEVPSNWFEANVFMDQAAKHIRQFDPLSQDRIAARKLLNDSMRLVLNEHKGVAA